MKTQIIVLTALTLLPLSSFFILFFVDRPGNIRLPTHIIPELYNISIRPYMEASDGELQYKFQGDVHIRIKPLIDTRLIIMHSSELNYTSLSYWPLYKPLSSQRLNKVRFDFKTERIIFNLRDILHANKSYNLHFQYLGEIHNKSIGAFRNEWLDENNVTRWTIATIMEPADARRVFPCFDEPKFKANFVLNIIRPSHMKSYSNTKRICSYVMGNYTRDIFAKTPKMSTYIVAFLIASYDEREAQGYSVLTERNQSHLIAFALEFGRKTLKALGDYLNFDYYDMGINKIDYASMSNLNFAAMENWGLVIAQESSMLYDEKSHNSERKDYVAKVIAHELAHNWFGNLITCDWWSYVWLNEGFATYFMYYGQAILNNGSDYEKWETIFILTIVQPCLSNNAKEDVSPLNMYNEAISRSLFNDIAYGKGAAFVRMVRGVLGESQFQKSLQQYIRTFKHKTATSNDVCKIWSKYTAAAFKTSFLNFCSTYTEQPGYPLIIINISKDGLSFEISQQRFLSNSHATAKSSAIFVVPISFTTDRELNFSRTQPAFYLNVKKMSFQLEEKSRIKWLIANIQSTGLYRVHYNTENWQEIAQALYAANFTNIPIQNRMQLVDDIQKLFCAGFVKNELLLIVLKYLRNEYNLGVWTTAIQGFHKILKYYLKRIVNFSSFMQEILENIQKSLSLVEQPSEDSFILTAHKKILNWSCKFGSKSCLDDCNHFLQHNENFEKLNENERFLVSCTILRHGNETIYQKFFDTYKKSNNMTEKGLIARALSCIKNTTLFETHFWNILHNFQVEDREIAMKTFCVENVENNFSIYKLIAKHFNEVSLILGGDVKVAQQIKKLSAAFFLVDQKQDLIKFTEKMASVKNKTIINILQEAQKDVDLSTICFI